ncbi:MAG: rRNA maturation RNase YbeY [Ktedonobacteraceae bacterium]
MQHMHTEHPQIELYITVGTDEENTAIEQILTTLNMDLLIQHTLQAVGVTQAVMLTLLITDDDAIRDMNKQYREQNKPTDVLSFPLLEKPLVNAPAEQLWMTQEGEGQTATAGNTPTFVTPPELVTNLGDIIISWPTVVRQASEIGHSSSYELLYLIAHGVLHLVGYDDQSEEGYQKMVQLQQTVLQEVGQRD